MKQQPEMTVGTSIESGHYIGRINVNGAHKGIVLPPKAERQYPGGIIYNDTRVPGATSYCDGMQNTRDMAAAGSKLAQWALDNDMHIPSQDELEIIYRLCKPTTVENYLFARSGINVSSIPPACPYTKDIPGQTVLIPFQTGGPEAFDVDDWYWSSTRRQVTERFAWAQGFKSGTQDYCDVFTTCLGVAVRWIDL